MVYELHGSVLRNYCRKCHKLYDLDFILHSTGVPHCSCGGVVKPDVVLYEESLDERTLQRSVQAIAEADMLIIAGTSLAVYPASGLVNYFEGSRLAVINRSPTPLDAHAGLVISGSVGEVLNRIQV